MNTEAIIEPPTTAIAEYSPVAAGLADLRARHEGVVYDLTTTAGDKAARAARRELVTLRTNLEETRKALKTPILKQGKLIDSEAARIEAEILKLEQPLDALIKADEARREEIRQAKAEAERQRVAALQRRVSALAAFPVRAMGEPSASVQALIEELEAVDVADGSWAEMAGEAATAKDAALERLRAAHAAAVAAEAEAARLAAERAELERREAELRRQQEEADRVRREQEAAAEAARQAEEARQRAEREAHEAAMRAEREAQEREAARQRVVDDWIRKVRDLEQLAVGAMAVRIASLIDDAWSSLERQTEN